MKNKLSITLSIMFLILFGVVGNFGSANASDCSVQNPCISRVFENPTLNPTSVPVNNNPSTWAVVDNSGTVRNIIVCQPSVCGSSGALGGSLNGDRLVQQTNTLYGQNTGPSQTVTENNGTFTVSRDVITSSESVVNTENNSEVIVTTKTREIFTFNVDTSENPVLINSIPAEVKAEEKINSVITQTETNIFAERLNINDVQTELENKNLSLLISKIDILSKLLDSWLKK